MINPNNPTGAMIRTRCCARSCDSTPAWTGLFADEVYDKVLYDDARHTALPACR